MSGDVDNPRKRPRNEDEDSVDTFAGFPSKRAHLSVDPALTCSSTPSLGLTIYAPYDTSYIPTPDNSERATASPTPSTARLLVPSPSILQAIQAGNLPDTFLKRFHSQTGIVVAPTPPASIATSPDDSTGIEGQCHGACDVATYDDVVAYREHVTFYHSLDRVLCKHVDCAFNIKRDKQTTGKLTKHYISRHGTPELKCRQHPSLCDYRTYNEDLYTAHIDKCTRKCRSCWTHNGRTLPYKTLEHLRAHMKKEHIQDPAARFPCTAHDYEFGHQCTRGFDTLAALQRHITTTHPGPYQCPYCPDGTTLHKSERTLALHIQNVHPIDFSEQWREKAMIQNFPCPFPGCGQVFDRSNNLGTHIESKHARVEKFKCAETGLEGHSKMVDAQGQPLGWDPQSQGCHHAFRGKQALVDHVRTVHFQLERWATFAKRNGLKEMAGMVGVGNDYPAASLLTGVFRGNE